MKLTIGTKKLRSTLNVSPSVTSHVDSGGTLQGVDIFLCGPEGYARGLMNLSEARRLVKDLTRALEWQPQAVLDCDPVQLGVDPT